jgi:hypothetical protein
MYCDEHGEHRGPHHGGRHGWQGCGGRGFGGFGPGMHFHRRFTTREERIAWLEEYLKELQAEAKAVEERIAELKAEE